MPVGALSEKKKTLDRVLTENSQEFDDWRAMALPPAHPSICSVAPGENMGALTNGSRQYYHAVGSQQSGDTVSQDGGRGQGGRRRESGERERERERRTIWNEMIYADQVADCSSVQGDHEDRAWQRTRREGDSKRLCRVQAGEDWSLGPSEGLQDC